MFVEEWRFDALVVALGAITFVGFCVCMSTESVPKIRVE